MSVSIPVSSLYVLCLSSHSCSCFPTRSRRLVITSGHPQSSPGSEWQRCAGSACRLSYVVAYRSRRWCSCWYVKGRVTWRYPARSATWLSGASHTVTQQALGAFSAPRDTPDPQGAGYSPPRLLASRLHGRSLCVSVPSYQFMLIIAVWNECYLTYRGKHS